MSPDTCLTSVVFQVRLLLDFQNRTVYHHLKAELPTVRGEVLDIGCGKCPYKHLLNVDNTRYRGLDIDAAAKQFDYDNADVIHFDGQTIPIQTSTIDFVICTEVLEHVPDPQPFIDQIFRILKPGARAIITVPWSARFHYIPYDWYRFTPSALSRLFQKFEYVTIVPRGTDITVIMAKIIVVYFRLLRTVTPSVLGLFQLGIAITVCPLIGLGILIGHLSLIFNWGSIDDPLGYTVLIEKPMMLT